MYYRLSAIGRTTEWHEGHDRFQGARKFATNEKLIAGELQHANVELKKLRHAKLLELYREEHEQHEQALNDMGFAILKDRL